MAFKRHPSFIPAPSPETYLWRYISVAKFLALLQQRSLHFGNLELLARSDPFEGCLPSSNFSHRNWKQFADAPPELQMALVEHCKLIAADPIEFFEIFKANAEDSIERAYAYRRSYFVNCWHLNDQESAAMWHIYSRNDEGVAIISSEMRVAAALTDTLDTIYGSQLKYGDYEDLRFRVNDRNGFNAVLSKRANFMHEREYRLVYWDDSVTHKTLQAEDGYFDWDGRRIEATPERTQMKVTRKPAEICTLEIRPSHLVPCNLEQLIASVVISPLAPSWMTGVIEELVGSHGYGFPVRKSAMLNVPRR